MALALDGDRRHLVALCLRCSAVVSVWSNMFRAKPGPCATCRRAESRMRRAPAEVGGCRVVQVDRAHLVLACPCGAEFRLARATAKVGQTHTPRRCPACRAKGRGRRA